MLFASCCRKLCANKMNYRGKNAIMRRMRCNKREIKKVMERKWVELLFHLNWILLHPTTRHTHTGESKHHTKTWEIDRNHSIYWINKQYIFVWFFIVECCHSARMRKHFISCARIQIKHRLQCYRLQYLTHSGSMSVLCARIQCDLQINCESLNTAHGCIKRHSDVPVCVCVE